MAEKSQDSDLIQVLETELVEVDDGKVVVDIVANNEIEQKEEMTPFWLFFS